MDRHSQLSRHNCQAIRRARIRGQTFRHYAGPPVDSTAYEDGFWYNQIMQGDRQYYFSVDAIFGKTSKPSTTLIGAPYVNPLTADSIAGRTGGLTTGATTTGTTNLVGSDAVQSGAARNRAVAFDPQPARAVAAVEPTGTTGAGSGSPNIFPAQNTGVLTDTLNGTGLRGTWGWFNPDDTGFVVSGFYAKSGTIPMGIGRSLSRSSIPIIRTSTRCCTCTPGLVFHLPEQIPTTHHPTDWVPPTTVR